MVTFLALFSGNLVTTDLISPRENFHYVNNEFVDSLILEAVELDDLESIEAILAWRNIKASEMGITEVDRRLLRMQKNAQEVIICAAIKNNYSIVKMLHSDGYKIFDKVAECTGTFFFSNGSDQAEYCMDAGQNHLKKSPKSAKIQIIELVLKFSAHFQRVICCLI